MAEDVALGITGDPSGYNAAMDAVERRTVTAAEKMRAAMTASAQQMSKDFGAMKEQVTGHFDKISAGISKIQGLVVGIGATIAAGGGFGAAVEVSSKWTSESVKLGKALGITATDASVLNVALGSIFTDADTMIAASTKVSKALGENESKFKDLGVQTRDAKGHFRPMLDIILETSEKLLKFREGTDRNVEGIKIFGKAWNDVQPILKLTNELMKDSKAKAEALGLVVGQENVEANLKYKKAMEDVHRVIMAITKAVGDALMPVLTEMGNAFAETGPERVGVMIKVMNILIAVFEAVRLMIEIVWQTIVVNVSLAVNRIMMLVEIVQRVMAGDWDGAKAAWKRGMDAQVAIVEDGVKKIIKQYDSARLKLTDMMANDGKTPTAAPKGTETSTAPAAAAAKSRFSAWKEALEQQKIEQDNFFKEDLAAELTYWQQKLAIANLTKEERIQVNHQVFALRKQMAQQDLAEEIAELNFKKELLRGNAAEQLEIEKQKAERIRQSYGDQSRQYTEAQREIQRATRSNQEELRRIEELRIDAEKKSSVNALDLRREELRLKLEFGQVTAAAEIASLRALKEEEYQIERSSLEAKMALIKGDVAARRAAKDEIRALEEKHRLEVKKSVNDEIIANKKQWEQWLAPVTSAFDTSIKGMILGTTTLKKAMGNIFQSILGEFINMGVKMVARWAITQFALTEIETAASIAAAAAKELAEMGASQAIIAGSAAEAGAGGVASMAAAPFPLNLGAPEFGAAMAALAASYGAMTGFAVGAWNVPEDMFTKIHRGETIVPAQFAEKYRDGGDGNGGGMNLTIHAVDAKGVRDLFMREGGALVKALKRQQRNFNGAMA